MVKVMEKVLNTTKKYGKFNRSIAKKAFKSTLAIVENRESYIDGSIMRAARKLRTKGLLVNRGDGNYYLRSR